ncbi:MAG: BamA/TamA family outer membrane protein [Gemmatimonadota bacterium]|nr:BamA/TamA family outer membrane protein [Gemmatimonadota bacterium]
MRRVLSGGVVAALAVASPAAAQYFGQNKVQYRHLEFAVIATEHFDVHFYEEERAAALDAARMAERAYARLSRVLNHQYRERQPIILFASHSEFQQNNITDIGDATGGVTDAYRHRVMLPLTGAYRDFDHVLQHEMVHQFQFDVFARGRVGAGIARLIAVQPPLWLFEGMAEYLSLGPITPLTASWLRNAALEGHLPSIREMSTNPRIFPYRYGHALMAFIGERWGDEVIGEILHAVAAAGVEAGFRQALHMSLDELTAEWHYAVRREYLPAIAERQPARLFARPALTERRTRASFHLSPAVSPDGLQIAYLSEGNSYFIDLWVAETETGRVLRRLTKSAFSADLENLRYLYSTGSWSRDGRYFAVAAKSGGQDDIIVFDMQRHRVQRRIRVPLHGVTTPTWAPDGQRLAFTGQEGGLSDLFVVNLDGSDLVRLTRDKYADLQPTWSPDGRTIAFTTDRGPDTDLETLQVAELRIALYDLASNAIRVLDGQEGRNINPQWAPDSRSVAYVSDRTGTANVFLHDLDAGADYQLTDVLTAVTGITDLSPAISWAWDADRLVFSVYEGEDFTYNVYWVDDPRSLKRAPYQTAPAVPLVAGRPDTAAPAAAAPAPLAVPFPTPRGDTLATQVAAQPTGDTTAAPVMPVGSFYRGDRGFRWSAAEPTRPDSAPPMVSVRALLDSATLALPDTSAFEFRDYSGGLAPDYIAQPAIGYARDNFGRGFYGGAAIQLSDLLGNRRMLAALQINGRLDEAQALFAYGNQSRRANWVAGYEQYPLFFYTGSTFSEDSLGLPVAIYSLTRYMTRQVFGELHRPFNRFRRVEFGLRLTDVGLAEQQVIQTFDPVTGAFLGQDVVTRGLGHDAYVQPSVALVFDNSVSLWVGPLMGRRHRFEYAPAIGEVRYHQFLADYRRYDHLVGPFTLATRALFFGRFGRDDNRFLVSLSNTDFIRGYTFGSFRDNECLTDVSGTLTGCAALDQVIGTRVGVFNAELRFPLVRALALGILPLWFPPIEGALFFDAGIAWQQGNALVWKREPTDNPAVVRQPLASWGFSARVNMFGFAIFRFDYTKPLTRADGVPSYWTVSIGPTF